MPARFFYVRALRDFDGRFVAQVHVSNRWSQLTHPTFDTEETAVEYAKRLLFNVGAHAHPLATESSP